MNNSEKIKQLSDIIDMSKDLIEFLKIEPKLKVNIHSKVLNERISLSEDSLIEMSLKLKNKKNNEVK